MGPGKEKPALGHRPSHPLIQLRAKSRHEEQKKTPECSGKLETEEVSDTENSEGAQGEFEETVSSEAREEGHTGSLGKGLGAGLNVE